jgi:4-hydroxy-tetrahydrodipicolinate synthase
MINLGELITAMVTPFDKENKINFGSCRKLISHIIDQGSDGILLSGSTGECATLSDGEKIELFNFAKVNFGDKAKIIAGTSSNDTAHSLELSKEAEKIGVDCILLTVPYYNKPSQLGIFKHFEKIAGELKTPVILYNVPSRTCSNMESKTCVELSKIDNICGVKEASGNMKQIAEIIRDTDDDFIIYSGNDGDTLPILSMGGYGVISVASHIIGSQIKEMIDSFKAGDFINAARINRDFLDIFYGIFISTNPVPIKKALDLMGFDAGPCRLPLCPMEDDKLDSFMEILKKHKLIK